MLGVINKFNESTFSVPQKANKAVTVDKYSRLTAANPRRFKDQTNWQYLAKISLLIFQLKLVTQIELNQQTITNMLNPYIIVSY